MSDVDAQYLISLAELLESAYLAGLEVEVVTSTGRSVTGVPRGTGSRRAIAPGERWGYGGSFSLGSSIFRLDEIVCCTVHAREGTGQLLDQAVRRSLSEDHDPTAPRTHPHHGSDTTDVPAAHTLPAANLHLTIPADRFAPATARHLAAMFLGHERRMTGHRTSEVMLIISELVSNAVLHAYEPAHPGVVALDLGLDGPVLTILVSDDGRGPRAASAGPLRHAGLGWEVVAQLSDSFAVTERDPGGTLAEVRLALA